MQLNELQTAQLKEHWPLKGEFRFHRRVANFVYFVQMHEQEVVLRLTEPHHRQLDEIHAEMHWMSYLSEQGMKIATPISTNNGEFVLPLEGQQKYYATVISKAPGRPMKDEEITRQNLEIYGRYLGKMHRLTKDYSPPKNALRRQEWRDDETLSMALRAHEISDPIAFQRMNEVLEWLGSLPKTRDSYGLVHCDLHMGNFFLDGESITAFDFDDSCYQWFSHDLTAPLMSFQYAIQEKKLPVTEKQLLSDFLVGYAKENSLQQVWIDRISIFQVYRKIVIYHWIKTSIREHAFDEKALAWAKNKLPKLLLEIEKPIHFF